MSTGGQGTLSVPQQGMGAEHGYLKDQLNDEGGKDTVQLSSDVADRFEAAKQGAHERTAGTGPSPIDEKHKAGFEQAPDRVRSITEVTKAKVQSGGKTVTRTPEVGFPARPHVH